MSAVIAILMLVVALGAARQLPPLVVLGVVSVIAFVLRSRADETARTLLGLDRPSDPWATPSSEARRLARRSLRIAMARTELASCYPDRGF